MTQSLQAAARLKVLHGAEPRRMGLKPDELETVALLHREALTLEGLLSRTEADEGAVRRLLYGLLITRCIDLSGQTRRPVGVGAVPDGG